VASVSEVQVQEHLRGFAEKQKEDHRGTTPTFGVAGESDEGSTTYK